MKYFIITGTSRGIGESLVKILLNDGNNQVICISRGMSENINFDLGLKPGNVLNFSFDLNNLTDIESLFESVFSLINEDDVDSIYLINNAGILSPIGPIEETISEDVIRNINVNLIAPILLTSNFIRYTNNWEIDKRVLNISSGSAKYLLSSQSPYSTAKAGLDSFTKSIYLEQKEKPYPVKVASVYPGVIETKLQAEIRSTSKEKFPYVELFNQLFEEGKLQTPLDTAEKLIQLLMSSDYGKETLVEELS
ncbi:(S)-benzoin forming benzil reductase [Gracilibacillus sp. S3-1-1]|uniref:(S)-benzoin forming benzil reductase n=1 Tax=Gracilibacillus pellucidus TaxID=3095368 RepID=A0ACC6M7X4_9BACI|nr:(S)-benzoin forming benzil reductase [Gracilibacillus sp. S3-1-1]MDX8047079.1 (S)-benzoin forming benzil reductase [Gracilibacillus sp. S3-1-1]